MQLSASTFKCSCSVIIACEMEVIYRRFFSRSVIANDILVLAHHVLGTCWEQKVCVSGSTLSDAIVQKYRQCR